MRSQSWAVVAVALILTGGCGSGPRIVPVSGIVLIDDVPLQFGTVQVAPAGFRAAYGKIGSDGRFTLTTTHPNDGCVLGTHPATIVATESLGPGAQKWHAPRKYAKSDESGLTVTIDGPTNDLTIRLTWAGGKPFVQQFNKE